MVHPLVELLILEPLDAIRSIGSEARWEKFAQDARAFRRQEAERYYDSLQSPHGSSTSLHETTRRMIEDAKFPPTDKFAARVMRHFFARCDEKGISQPHDAIMMGMMGTAAAIYAMELLAPDVRDRVDIPDPSDYGQSIGAGQLRDLLLVRQHQAANAAEVLEIIRDSLIESFLAVTRHLPGVALDGPRVDGVPTVPYIDLVPNFGVVVEDVLAPFITANRFGLFRVLREQIKSNFNDARGNTRARKPPAPSEYEGSPQEIVDTYIGEAAFRFMFDVRIPFDIPLEDRGEHTAIVAGSGWGKTQLLQSIIADDLERDDPPAMVIIDSTGAMPQRIQRLAIFNGELKDRLIIIDPEGDPVPALNMFDVSNPRIAGYSAGMREALESEVIGLFNYVFSSIQNPLTARMQTAFAFMVRLLLSIPGANMRTLLELLDDDPPRGDYSRAVFKPHIDQLDDTTRHFFEVQYYTGKESGLREQIRARVFDIIKVPAFERMFAGVNRVDFFAELNRGSIIVINTSENLLKDGSATFGRYMIARVMAAAFERSTIPPSQRKQAFLIVDEAAPYFDETFEKLLTRVRQFKLGVCIAFQHLEQASEKLRSAIASSTAVKYAGGTGYADARWLGREMRVDPEFILAQKRDSRRPPQWSQFACYVRNYTDQAISLTVPFYALESMPQMTEEEHAALLLRNRERVSEPSGPQSGSPPRPAGSADHNRPSVPARISPPKSSHTDAASTPQNLAEAYSELGAALSRGDLSRASHLKNDIIPNLEKASTAAAPGPATEPSPAVQKVRSESAATGGDTSRSTATRRDNPETQRQADSGSSEGATDWR